MTYRITVEARGFSALTFTVTGATRAEAEGRAKDLFRARKNYDAAEHGGFVDWAYLGDPYVLATEDVS
jgi:hypothetical protein